MHVVLDSTALIADFSMKSSPMRSLLEASKNKVISVVVPELVLLEVVHKWTWKLEELAQKARGISKDARLLGLSVDSSVVPSDATEKYEEELRSTLAEHSISIRNFPPVSHEYLVRKAIERRAPFNEKGTGYRDALIWETVKELLRTTSGSVVFVTNNSSDFGSSERDENIKQELVDELVNDGIEPTRLRVVKTSSGAAAVTLDRAQRLLEGFKERLESDDAFKDRLYEELTQHADLTLPGGSFRSFGGTGRFLRAHTLNHVSYFGAIRSWPVSETRIGLEFETEADVDVDIEYEDEEGYPYLFDPERDRWPSLFLNTGTVTVTASLAGQLEFDETTNTLSSVELWIYALSEPDLEGRHA